MIRIHWNVHLLYLSSPQIAQEIQAILPLASSTEIAFSETSYLVNAAQIPQLLDLLSQRGYTPRLEGPLSSASQPSRDASLSAESPASPLPKTISASSIPSSSSPSRRSARPAS